LILNFTADQKVEIIYAAFEPRRLLCLSRFEVKRYRGLHMSESKNMTVKRR